MRRLLASSLIAFSTLTVCTSLTPASVSAAEKAAVADEAMHEDTYELLRLFGDVFDRVRSDYVEEVKDADLIEAAINGMLTSLDPHSGYMNAKAYKEMQVQTRGEFGGLGIEVTMENGLVKVVSPIDDTPAYEAGMKAGDFVSHIDEEPVMGLNLSEAVEKMRGRVGTKIKLTVLREGVSEPLEVEIVRDIIKIKAVKARREGDIAYIRINAFTERTTPSMRAEITKLKKEIGDMRGVVLDLRNNPGGLLDQAISVSDAFLEKGEIVSTRERNISNTKRFNAHEGDEIIPMEMPIIVLINNGSASASEIVSGAIQDHNRGIVLGTQSFGKGSVQTVVPIPEHGAIRLTTSRYYTPSGTSIQATGITPDIVVEPARIEPLEIENMRKEADLRRRLQNLQYEKDGESDSEDTGIPATKMKGRKDGELESEQDYQLQRALDLLRAVNVYNHTKDKLTKTQNQ